MADQDLSHTADIIKASVPYIDGGLKNMAELFAKLLDLMGSVKSAGNSDKVSAYGFQGIKIDIEGLLKGIRPICNRKEQEFVDKILNIFNMKRMFEMYNNMMSAMQTMQEFSGFSSDTSDADNVTNNFSGLNYESIFQNFSNIFSSDSTSGTADVNAAQYHTSEGEAAENSHTENTSYHTEDMSGTKNEDATNSSSANNSATSNNSTKMMNNKMFDMLKAMVPPEQMSTFENLSMLLNTMSYDNTSKPDDSKEHNDG